jgi:hypothetical protein
MVIVNHMIHWLKFIFTFNLIVIFGVSAIADTLASSHSPSSKKIASLSVIKSQHSANKAMQNLNFHQETETPEDSSEGDSDLESDDEIIMIHYEWLKPVFLMSAFNLNQISKYIPPDLTVNTPPPKS